MRRPRAALETTVARQAALVTQNEHEAARMKAASEAEHTCQSEEQAVSLGSTPPIVVPWRGRGRPRGSCKQPAPPETSTSSKLMKVRCLRRRAQAGNQKPTSADEAALIRGRVQ